MSAEKFKEGDQVRVKLGLEVGKNYGVISFTEEQKSLCGEVGVVTNVFTNLGGVPMFYNLSTDGRTYNWTDEMLEPVPYKVGDVLVSRNDVERMILAVSGLAYLPSLAGDFGHTSDSWYTEQELKDMGYTLKTSKPKEETVDVLGKKYKKKDVEDRLKKLKEVED